VRAASYGAPSSCHACRARRSETRAAPRVAFCQLDRALNVLDDCAQHHAVVERRDFGKLIGCTARLGAVSDGQHDLNARGQETCPLQRLRGFAESPADSSCRDLGVSLCEPQQRQPGLGLQPVPIGLPIGGLGCDEVSLKALDLPLLIQGVTHRRRVHRPLGPLPRAASLLERLAPRTVELHDLGPMSVTPAAERDQLGLLLAPA
jgi:hypothetical protein